MSQKQHHFCTHFLALTSLIGLFNCKGAGECRLPVCLGRRKKMVRVSTAQLYCTQEASACGQSGIQAMVRNWYYRYSAGDAEFLGNQVWTTTFFFCNNDTCTAVGDGTVLYLRLLTVGQFQLGLICVEPNKILIKFCELPSFDTILGYWLYLREMSTIQV